MTSIFVDGDDESAHSEAIADLALKVQLPESEVRETYEAVYLELNGDAQVRDYLAVLVTRRTRELLKRDSRTA